MAFGKRKPASLRESERHGAGHVKQAGEILTPGQPPRRCEVTNLTASGARLSLNSVFGVASMFELRVGRNTYRARVISRSAGTLEVTFR
jgi:hypothetical protein